MAYSFDVYRDLGKESARSGDMNISKVFSNVSMFVMCASGVLLYQCTGAPESANDGVNYYNERQDIARDLVALRNNIDRDIEKTGKARASSREEKDRLSRASNTFIEQKEQVETMLGNVNNATEETWGKVRKDARLTLSDVKRICQKLEKNEIAEK
jgi:hypothetical protein